MFALLKPFLIAVSIIIFLFFVIGLVEIEKPAYGCFVSKKLKFDSKVTILDIGRLKLYMYPLVSECAEEDRFDPARVYNCGVQRFCQRDIDEPEQAE